MKESQERQEDPRHVPAEVNWTRSKVKNLPTNMTKGWMAANGTPRCDFFYSSLQASKVLLLST